MKQLKYILDAFSFCILLLGVASFISFLWILNNFGNVRWEQILLNLVQPMDGVAIHLFVSGVLLIGVIGFLAALMISKILQKISCKYAWLACILIGILLMSWPVKHWNLIDFVLSRFIVSDLYEREHITPGIQTNGRNLIFIVLESYEKSFQNEAFLGQNLSPRLTAIQKENISFSGFKQLHQTGWTITSLVSSFCGVPLKLNKMFVDLSLYRTFIPGLPCWTEELAAQGYENVLMKAAAIQFTGTDRFALQHGFQKAVGFRELSPVYGDENTSPWGLNDRTFYQAVKDELKRLGSQNKPFMLATVEADTHQPKGYANPTCAPIYGDYRDAVLCSDKEVSELIEWIKQQPFYPNTTIVVMGDHLVWATDVDDLIEKIPNREIYFTIINPAVSQKPHDHTFTNLDVGPTVLDALGFDFSGRYGLGHSLYRDEKTLIEKEGNNRLSFELDCISEKYRSWGNDMSLTVYEIPENLEMMPIDETVLVPSGLSKYFAAQDLVEMARHQYWMYENKASFKFKTDSSLQKDIELTANFIVPATPKTPRKVRVYSGKTELAHFYYDKHTIATEKIIIPAHLVKKGIVDLLFEVTAKTKKTYIGLHFLSFKLDIMPSDK